jgi:excisionase family DNA binding protein
MGKLIRGDLLFTAAASGGNLENYPMAEKRGRRGRMEKPPSAATVGPEVVPPILTLTEVARYLRVHPSTIYRLLKLNQLPAFRVGSDWRFKLEDIDKFRFGVDETAPKKAPTKPL